MDRCFNLVRRGKRSSLPIILFTSRVLPSDTVLTNGVDFTSRSSYKKNFPTTLLFILLSTLYGSSQLSRELFTTDISSSPPAPLQPPCKIRQSWKHLVTFSYSETKYCQWNGIYSTNKWTRNVFFRFFPTVELFVWTVDGSCKQNLLKDKLCKVFFINFMLIQSKGLYLKCKTLTKIKLITYLLIIGKSKIKEMSGIRIISKSKRNFLY